MIKKHPYDIFGNIVLVKFPHDTKNAEKKKFARELLKKTSATTILEKVSKFSGRLRKQKTRHIAGVKTKEVKYKENNCVFRFNIDTTYFSPRLSNERKEIASKIHKGENVLVMFAGVAPFSIVIAKNSKAEKVYSNEINREANKYAELNIELNKLKNKVVLLPGDIKKIANKIKNMHSPSARDINRIDNQKTVSLSKKIKTSNQFEVIVMPRPRLKDTFLPQAFKLSKKGTRIFYYDFCKEDEAGSVVEKIKQEAKKSKKQVKILNTKTAGEIGPGRIRVRVDFKLS